MFSGQAVVLDTGFSRKTIGRSRGIDNDLADQLLKLAPSPAVLVGHLKGCLEISRLTSDLVVVSRTVFARRQTEQGVEQGTLSRFIVVNRQQLAVFNDNPATLAFHLQSEGTLHFHGNLKANLDEIRLPDSRISNVENRCPTVAASNSARVLRAIEIHGRVAIVGVTNALAFLSGLLSHFPPDRRLATNFSIGTMFSETRSFELLVYPEFNDGINRKLVNAQIRTISGSMATVLTH